LQEAAKAQKSLNEWVMHALKKAAVDARAALAEKIARR
jgi:predicted HicB family RNase H-like nuclease